MTPDDVAAIHRALAARGASVAVAESLTAGLVCAELTRTPGASATVRGGLVVYATDLKHTLAGVPEDLLRDHPPASAPVAAALATGVRGRLGATFGLSLTGVAGPEPQHGVPVGTLFVGLAAPAGGPAVHGFTLAGTRDEVRGAAVTVALEALRTALRG